MKRISIVTPCFNEEDNVRLLGVARELEAFGLAEHVRHARRIVFVHLAAECRDVEPAAHVVRDALQGRKMAA